MAFQDNRFCWLGIVSPDPAAAEDFYTKVLGWEAIHTPTGATMFAAEDGVPLAHLAEGAAHWEVYLRVTDVDQSHAQAVAAGGVSVTPPTNIPVGRYSVVNSPSGAPLHLFHEADEDSFTHSSACLGSVDWTELWSTDTETDLDWLRAVFGFTVERMPLPDGAYFLLQNGEHTVGGCAPPHEGTTQSQWFCWIQVDAIEQVAAAVVAAGGHTRGELTSLQGVGQLLVVEDVHGCAFGLLEPAP